MIRLVQFLNEDGARSVAISSGSDAKIPVVKGFTWVYDMAREALRRKISLGKLAQENLSGQTADLDEIIASGRILSPIDHPDPAHCVVSLTGLTHLPSAKSRDEMHAPAATAVTDTARMFQIGVDGGKPSPGEIGAQPEWAYKGDGRCIVPPEGQIHQPAFADDGGEEAEVAGIYIIDDSGNPWRIGYAIGNEFADHVLERKNYLYLAHSKLRQCAIGPELLLGELPEAVGGTIRIVRGAETVWTSPFASGEAQMCHSIANLEHHHFKYEIFRRPGDVHIHFFGASSVSFGQGIRTEAGDRFEIDVPLFGRPLRNTLAIDEGNLQVTVRSL